MRTNAPTAMNRSGFVGTLLLFEAQHCQNASCTSGSPPQPKGSNLLFAECRTQIVCSPSCMQSPPGHTLYFAADPTHIICIYSRSVPPPSLSLFFSGHMQKENFARVPSPLVERVAKYSQMHDREQIFSWHTRLLCLLC